MRHHSQETAPSLYVQAAKDAFRKLDPRVLVRNPVMFVVAVGCVFTTASFFSRVVTGADAGFSGQISLWLWFTVLFANFAEALAEGRGKAQADTLRSARTDTVAHRLLSDGTVETVSASELAPGDRVVVEAGDMIPADGTVVEGVAAVDESAITGESAPVIRESGGDRSAVTGGTTVLSDRIVVNVTQEPGKSFLDRMIALVEGAERQKTPNEIALNILLAGLTLIFMLVVVTLKPLGLYHGINIDMVVLVALLVGSSLLVNAVEQIQESARPLAVLGAVGVRRSTVMWSVFLQNAVPLVLALVVAVPCGVVLGAMLGHVPARPLWVDPAGLGLVAGSVGVLALVITALVAPVVSRALHPGGLRTG